MRDKIITAACRTTEGIEWTALKIHQDGSELVEQRSMPVNFPDEITEETLEATPLPPELCEHLSGDLTVAMRTSELLMRTMVLPSSNPAEIADMISFQIDKISPYPIEQLAIAHEILTTGDDSSTVLMVAAKRAQIDAIGHIFQGKGMRIHSIDVRILGWIDLLRSRESIAVEGCEVLIIDDGIDFALAVLHDGHPLILRSLYADPDDMDVVDELVQEIGYTLTALDAEHELPAPAGIQIWSFSDFPKALQSKLAEKTGLKVSLGNLDDLPPLSQGIIDRTTNAASRIELIPGEWVEHQRRRELLKKFGVISGSMAALWLLVLLIFFSIYKVRDMKLAAVRQEAETIRPVAEQALQNRRKLRTLKMYADRSDSALESLREATRLLPVGDIEFVSFNYTKGKAITLRGTADSNNLVNDYFSALNKTALYNGTKNESTSIKTTKGVKRAIWTVTLPFPEKEGDS